MSLKITIDVDPDADGVIDGRLVAQQLISYAFRALVPYVNGCHACADNLFEALANKVLTELHDDGHATGEINCIVFPGGLSDDVYEGHFDKANESTRALLERTPSDHQH